MVELHTSKHGYTEVLAPYLANREAMISCGQIPKLEDEMFRIEGNGYFLIPTVYHNVFGAIEPDAGSPGYVCATLGSAIFISGINNE